MEQEDKELLLRDLCARLPYGVKVKTNNINILKLGTHTRVGEYVTDVTEPCKPYLFPLSSMTEEQKKESPFESSLLNAFINGYISLFEDEELAIGDVVRMLEWLNKNHFDYRGLIERGLAIDCTNLNIY